MTHAPDLGSAPVVALSWALDLDKRRLQQLAAEGHFPKPERGQYPIAETVRAYVGLLRDQIARTPSSPDEKVAKARKTEAEAGLAEIDLAKARGEVAVIALVADALMTNLAILRERLVAIPGRLPGDPTPAQRAAVADAINDALAELSDVNDLVAAGVAETAGGDAADAVGFGGDEAPPPPQPSAVGGAVPPHRSGTIRKPRPVADGRSARRLRPDAGGD